MPLFYSKTGSKEAGSNAGTWAYKQGESYIRHLASLFNALFYPLMQSWGECLQIYLYPAPAVESLFALNRMGYKCRRVSY